MNLPRSLLLSTILVFTYPSLATSEPMEMLYWTAERGIGRSYPDASNKEWIVEADLRRPGSIAIDEIAERVYWTHQAVIHRSNLDGTDLEVYSRAALGWASDRQIMAGLEIDIDSRDRKMYSTAIWWGDHTGEGMVEAFDLDADSLTVQGLAPSVNSFHAYWPYGTTVDPVNRRLYFLDWFSFYAVELDSLLSSDEHLFYPHLDRWPATTVYSQEEMEVERPGDWQGVYDLDLDHESGTMYWSCPMASCSLGSKTAGKESLCTWTCRPGRSWWTPMRRSSTGHSLTVRYFDQPLRLLLPNWSLTRRSSDFCRKRREPAGSDRMWLIWPSTRGKSTGRTAAAPSADATAMDRISRSCLLPRSEGPAGSSWIHVVGRFSGETCWLAPSWRPTWTDQRFAQSLPGPLRLEMC